MKQTQRGRDSSRMPSDPLLCFIIVNSVSLPLGYKNEVTPLSHHSKLPHAVLVEYHIFSK